MWKQSTFINVSKPWVYFCICYVSDMEETSQVMGNLGLQSWHFIVSGERRRRGQEGHCAKGAFMTGGSEVMPWDYPRKMFLGRGSGKFKESEIEAWICVFKSWRGAIVPEYTECEIQIELCLQLGHGELQGPYFSMWNLLEWNEKALMMPGKSSQSVMLLYMYVHLCVLNT